MTLPLRPIVLGMKPVSPDPLMELLVPHGPSIGKLANVDVSLNGILLHEFARLPRPRVPKLGGDFESWA